MKSTNCNKSMSNFATVVEKARVDKVGTSLHMSTGIKDLDLALQGGLKKEELYVVKGRPSTGKTDFITALAYGLGSSGKNTLLFTPQNDLETISQKMLAIISGISYYDVRLGSLSDQDIDILKCSACSAITNHISMVWEITKINDIINEACQVKVDGGLDVIIIDSLELVKDKDNSCNKLLHTLKNLAIQLVVAIVVVSQITADNILDGEIELESSGADILIYLQNTEREAKEYKVKYNVKLYIYQYTLGSPITVDLAYRPCMVSFGSC